MSKYILTDHPYLVNKAEPLDNKSKVQTIEERDKLVTDGLAYESLKTYVLDEKKWYEYDGSQWNEITSGSGTVDLSEYTKTYTSLDELGLTTPTTAMAIYKAMPKYTTFLYSVYIANIITGLPDDNGLLEITKGGGDGASSRGIMTFTQSAGNSNGYKKKWVGEFKASNTDTSDSAVIWHQLAFQSDLDGLFQSVSNGKTAVANAITGKGVSTSSTATFATMATNIGKISVGNYKEETKSYTTTSSGITPLTITFSANVLGVKQVIPPTYSSRITTQTTSDIFTINGKELTLLVTGEGTWKVTALIKA